MGILRGRQDNISDVWPRLALGNGVSTVLRHGITLQAPIALIPAPVQNKVSTQPSWRLG